MKPSGGIALICFAVVAAAIVSGSAAAKDELPSWNDGPSKAAILQFVAAVTDEKGKD
jgi:hypothetical protein